MTTKIIIAMHKPYKTPEESVYLPLHVGAEGKDMIPGLTRDDTGENISSKNPMYCELTGLYWAWKNLDADAIGLVHYLWSSMTLSCRQSVSIISNRCIHIMRIRSMQSI